MASQWLRRAVLKERGRRREPGPVRLRARQSGVTALVLAPLEPGLTAWRRQTYRVARLQGY